MARAAQQLVPGLLLISLLAIGARLLTPVFPGSLSEITVGVVAGAVVANVVHLPVVARPGIRFGVQRLLRVGIVLLGARLSFDAVVGTGATALVIIVGCAAFALATVLILSRLAGIPPRLATLIAVGTAICGNSAIVATAPLLEAEDQEVSFAVATITVFGVAAVIVYPLIGSALGLSDATFGHWAGVAVNDTSQVTAAGFAFSAGAGSVATIVKLTRNLLIGPVLIGVGLWSRRSAAGRPRPGSALGNLSQFVPLFVLGFVTMAAANSAHVIPTGVGEAFAETSRILILAALCGVGLGTDLRGLKSVGAKPLYVGLASAAALSVVGLAASLWLVG
jgi:uncharacterized integral membrane protein (TIGR00698 family)